MTDPRVLWLHSHFLLPTGGTKYIYEVTRRLAEDVPTTVLVERASPLWRERYAKTPVELVEVGGPSSVSLGYWAAFPVFLWRDAQAIRRAASSADVIVSSFFPMPWLASKSVRGTKRHIALCFEPFPFFHDREVISMYPRGKRLLLRLLKALYVKLDLLGVRAADQILTLNESTADQIARVYGRNDAILVRAGVDTELFRPYGGSETADLAARFGDGPLCVHSTDFSPIKRTDLAIRAFAVAHGRAPESRLIVTSTRSDPREENLLMALAKDLGVADAVVMAGFLAFEDLPRLYARALAVLQTGTAVGSGATTMALPVKEALACGTPVVRAQGTGEDVEDGVSGYVVDPRDSESAGRRLADLLTDEARARTMGLAGRRRIEREYSWPAVVAHVRTALSE